MGKVQKINEIINNQKQSYEKYKTNIAKLIKNALDFNKEVINLGTLLKHLIENQKKQLDKESQLALKEEEKPYGERNLELVKNETLIYYSKNIRLENTINEFIEILDTYNEVNGIEKKEMFEKFEVLIEYLIEYGVEPKSFVINPTRKKVWDEVIENFKLTVKKVDIEYFIDTIKIIKQKHSDTIYALNEYNKKVDEFFNNIDNEEKNTEYPKHEINLEPLLLDTKNLLEKIDLNFDELPEHLQSEQKEELKEFLPVIHEYYKDQICKLSGGVSYTPLSKSLQHIQKLIDNDEPLSIILNELPTLQYSMQHLYVLHWITESLLKEILECFHFKCSLGNTIKLYNKKFPNTQTSFEHIRYAVHFRNKVAHKGYIWKPGEFEKSIINYRRYVDIVTMERNVDLDSFHLGVIDNKIDIETKKNRFKKYLKQQKDPKLTIDEKVLSEEMIKKGVEFFEKYHWRPSDSKLKSFIYSIKRKLYEKFANEHFDGMSYEEVKECLIKFALNKEKLTYDNKEDIERYALKDFYKCVYQKYDKKQIEKKIKEMKKKIQKSCNKEFFKGFRKWF
jgi:hypothetical protein